MKLVSVSFTAPITVAPDTPTPIVWDDVIDCDMEDVCVEGAKIIFDMPRRVRFSASLVFPGGTEAYAQVWSRFNGTDYPFGYLSRSQPIHAYTNSVSGSVTGPWIDTPAGYWELIAYHRSPASLELQPLASSWMQVEMV